MKFRYLMESLYRSTPEGLRCDKLFPQPSTSWMRKVCTEIQRVRKNADGASLYLPGERREGEGSRLREKNSRKKCDGRRGTSGRHGSGARGEREKGRMEHHVPRVRCAT